MIKGSVSSIKIQQGNLLGCFEICSLRAQLEANEILHIKMGTHR